jgi:ABC-type nitrate/sulfonate/bicarbonate transport system permease component
LYETGAVYLGIFLSLLCALVANYGLSTIERRYTRWRESQSS